MKANLKTYLKLFASTFSLSAFTFGGGYVIVPLMQKRFVDTLHWIDEEEMLDLVAISQSSPGPIAVNASVIIGYRIGGILGAIISLLGTVLPPLITISIISIAYSAFCENEYVAAVLRGMQAGVAAVICDVVYGMAAGIFKKKNAFSIAIMLLSFAAAYFLNINVVFVILACAVIGLILGALGKAGAK